MVAGEARRPRIYIKNAFKTVYWRFALFFMGGSLAVGIVLSSVDPTLKAIISGKQSGSGTAAASPYVIAMANMGITGLPHLVSALLVTSIFSAGNTYTFCATRSLYGLAIEGRAPKALRYCTKSGVPLVCFAIVMVFPCLAFLQVSNGSNVVLGWLINLVTAGGVINYWVMCVTYIFFYRACKAQALDRNTLPYKGWFQPYSVSSARNSFSCPKTNFSSGMARCCLDDYDRLLLRIHRLCALLRQRFLHLLHSPFGGPCHLLLLETHQAHSSAEASRGRSCLGTSYYRQLRSNIC
jgi:amino acid permease